MAEEVQTRIQHGVEKMISALDKEILRKMQVSLLHNMTFKVFRNRANEAGRKRFP